MPHVNLNIPAFRHEFYAVAVKADGGGKALAGHFRHFPNGATLFFNSPFQVISWDISPNWQGYYIIFSQEFLAQSRILANVLSHFPFLKIDTAIPFEIPSDDLPAITAIYDAIYEEYHGDAVDKFHLIEAQIFLLLTMVKRIFDSRVDLSEAQKQFKTADLKLLSRYQTLIETSFQPDARHENLSNIHSTAFYAQKLSVHPNHLNAVVKSITGQTALNHIHHHILNLAKAYLAQSEMSAKEIAFLLRFETANAFSSFFKRKTGETALEYRKKSLQ